jgi:tetratricopeptide (TPR) repeat protein
MRLLIAFLLLASAAHAQKGSARLHFDRATTHFAVGEFEQAGEEYQLAYKARPDPALLYNAAQAFRLANKPEKALILYKNYVQLYPRERNVDEVRGQIQKLKDAIASAESAKSAPPTGPAEPAQPPPPDPAPARASEGGAQATAKSDKTPIHKKWWLWTIVGVVVVGGVVTTAVLLTTPSGAWNNLDEVGPGSVNGLSVSW